MMKRLSKYNKHWLTALSCCALFWASSLNADSASDLNQDAAAIASQYQSQVEQVTQAPPSSAPSQTGSSVTVFVSLGMPTLVLRQIIEEAHALQIPVIVRGVLNNDFKQSAKALYAVLHPQNEPVIPGGVSIDPPLFRQYGITQVPAVVVTGEDGFDVVYGNIPLGRAFQIIADHQGVGASVATSELSKIETQEAQNAY